MSQPINMLNRLKYFEVMPGVNVGWHESNMSHPDYPESNKGYPKTLTLEEVLVLAREIGGNIIIKAGKNAKWYIKHFPRQELDAEIKKQAWRDTHRATMYIVEFKDVDLLIPRT